MKERLDLNGGHVLDSHPTIDKGIETSLPIEPRAAVPSLLISDDTAPQTNITANPSAAEMLI